MTEQFPRFSRRDFLFREAPRAAGGALVTALAMAAGTGCAPPEGVDFHFKIASGDVQMIFEGGRTVSIENHLPGNILIHGPESRFAIKTVGGMPKQNVMILAGTCRFEYDFQNQIWMLGLPAANTRFSPELNANMLYDIALASGLEVNALPSEQNQEEIAGRALGITCAIWKRAETIADDGVSQLSRLTYDDYRASLEERRSLVRVIGPSTLNCEERESIIPDLTDEVFGQIVKAVADSNVNHFPYSYYVGDEPASNA